MNKKGPAAAPTNKPTTATSTKGDAAKQQPVPQVPPIDLNTPTNAKAGKLLFFVNSV